MSRVESSRESVDRPFFLLRHFTRNERILISSLNQKQDLIEYVLFRLIYYITTNRLLHPTFTSKGTGIHKPHLHQQYKKSLLLQKGPGLYCIEQTNILYSDHKR
jgi:hypothetical protein